MCARAREGTALLEELLALAIPLLEKAQESLAVKPLRPGRVPTYQDWQIAALILPGLLKKRKSKSATYRQMIANRDLLMRMLNLDRLPARSTFMQRYRTVWPLAQRAITLQGRAATRERLARPEHVSADKSIMRARGPVWHQKLRNKQIVPKLRAMDLQAGWGRSATRGWMWGYSYEVAVCAGRDALVFPLLASADTADACEMTTCLAKVAQLPHRTRTLAADSGYDSNKLADSFELDRHERPRRDRHFLCPSAHGPPLARPVTGFRRERQRQRRVKRLAYLSGKMGQRLYRRRKETAELFNANFKRLFELLGHVWHRGLDNNRSQLLLAIFSYQLLMRYHHKTGHRNEQIQYLLDSL
jgi:hypothetical protein